MGYVLFYRLTEIPTVPDFQILDSQPSKRVAEDSQMHHLLDTIMFDARRRVIKIEFISQFF